MKESEQASLSIKKIALITIALIFMLGVGVRATTDTLNTVEIILSDNYKIEVITTKKVVSEILEENHIIVLPTETVVPGVDAEISGKNATITITSSNEAVEIIPLADEGESVSMEQLLSNYTTVTEKIVTESEEIPYETVDRKGVKVDKENSKKKYKTTRSGKVGERQTTYRIKYQNNVEVERTTISETIVKKPRNEIVTEANLASISYSAGSGKTAAELAKLVEGIEPKKVTLNTSAYTASTCDKSPSSPTYGITASGARATAWYTVAAGSGYPMGTIIYIPYFANKPNGGWFVVQDRGGAIKNNKLDVYMNTYSECVSFGRRNLECYIYVK